MLRECANAPMRNGQVLVGDCAHERAKGAALRHRCAAPCGGVLQARLPPLPTLIPVLCGLATAAPLTDSVVAHAGGERVLSRSYATPHA